MDILQLLKDGQFHSGEELGAKLGISRAAIWKQLASCRQRGIDIDSVPGKGYRLAKPYEPLSQASLLQVMSPRVRQSIAGFEVHERIASTNDRVMQAMPDNIASAFICLAEEQTAGRGRRGREWVSPPASNLYGSVGWRFAEALTVVEGLSLAVGVAVVRALARYGVQGVSLKWPNDIMWQGAKLGGVLIDLQAESDGPTLVVIGVGLNLRTVPGLSEQLGRPIAALEQCVAEPLERNRLIGLILDELLLLLMDYAKQGFQAVQQEWQSYDSLYGSRVELSQPQGSLVGIARGVDAHGALLLETAQGLERIYGGEVSLRKEEA